MHSYLIDLTPIRSGVLKVFSNNISIDPIWQEVCIHKSLPSNLSGHIYFTKNGKIIGSNDILSDGDCFSLHLRLCGGKGGFGSMLRAMGSQIEKTTNKEACRDLSGRRMRDVNNEKKMLEWAKKKVEQDKEKEAKKIEKLEKKLERPKHFFNDPEYEKSLEATQDNVEDALKKGLEAHKRKMAVKPTCSNKVEPSMKKSKLWLGMEDDSDSDSSDEDDDDTTSPALLGLTIPTSGKGSSSSNSCDDCTSSLLDSQQPNKPLVENVDESQIAAK